MKKHNQIRRQLNSHLRVIYTDEVFDLHGFNMALADKSLFYLVLELAHDGEELVYWYSHVYYDPFYVPWFKYVNETLRMYNKKPVSAVGYTAPKSKVNPNIRKSKIKGGWDIG